MAYNPYIYQTGNFSGGQSQQNAPNMPSPIPNQMNNFQNGFNNFQNAQPQMNGFQGMNNMPIPPMPTPQPQQQIQDGGFVYVQNEDEFIKYPVAHGYSVTFKNETAPYLYKKTLGFSLLDTPILEKYRLVKEEINSADGRQAEQYSQPIQVSQSSAPVQQQTAETHDYIERDELVGIIDKLNNFSDAIELLKKNFSKMQTDIDVLSTKTVQQQGNKEKKG